MVQRRLIAGALFALVFSFAASAQSGCSHSAIASVAPVGEQGPGGAPRLVRGPASYYVSLPAFGVIAQVDPATGQIFNTFFGPSVGLMLADSIRPQVFGISGDGIAVIGTVFQHTVTTIRLPEPVVSWALASRAGRLYVAGVQTV